MTRRQRLALLTTQANDNERRRARRQRQQRERVLGPPKGMRQR